MSTRRFLLAFILFVGGCADSPFNGFEGGCEELETVVWDSYPRDDVNSAIPYLTEVIEAAVRKADAARVDGDMSEEDACADLIGKACNTRFEQSRSFDYEGPAEVGCFYNTGRFIYVPPDATVPETPERDLGFQTLP